MRILPQAAFRRGDTDFLQQKDRALPGLGAAHLLVPEQRFFQLVADGVGGIQRGHGLLEDHAHGVAADIRHAAFADFENIDAVVLQLVGAADGLRRQQIHDGKRCERLAAAGLADDAERLAAVQVKAHALHRVQHARRHRDVHGEVLDLENALHQFRFSGAVTSRTPSPSRLMERMRMKSAVPGMPISHGWKNMKPLPSEIIRPQLGAGG